MSPDEVATIMAQLGGLSVLWAIKRLLPGAEVVDLRRTKAREEAESGTALPPG